MIGMNGYPVSKGFVQKNFKSSQSKPEKNTSFEENGFENLLNAKMGFTIDKSTALGSNPSGYSSFRSTYNDAELKTGFSEETVDTEGENTQYPIHIEGLDPQNMDRLKKNSLSYNITSPVKRSIDQYNDFIPNLGEDDVKKPEKKLYQMNQDPELARGMQDLNQAMSDLKSALGGLF